MDRQEGLLTHLAAPGGRCCLEHRLRSSEKHGLQTSDCWKSDLETSAQAYCVSSTETGLEWVGRRSVTVERPAVAVGGA